MEPDVFRGELDAGRVIGDVWTAIRRYELVATRVKETGSGAVEGLGPYEAFSLESGAPQGAAVVEARHLLAAAGMISATEYVHPISSNHLLYRGVAAEPRGREQAAGGADRVT